MLLVWLVFNKKLRFVFFTKIPASWIEDFLRNTTKMLHDLVNISNVGFCKNAIIH